MGELFLLSTVPGLEDVVIREAVERACVLRASASNMSGRVVLEACGDPMRLMSMRTVENIARLIYMGSTSDVWSGEFLSEVAKYLTPTTTFGVVTTRVGEHEFTSPQVSARVGEMVQRYVEDRKGFRPIVNLRMPDLEIDVDIIHDKVYVSLLVTRRSLKDRPYRVAKHPAALNPVIAAAMVYISGLRDGETLCDLTCGSGTIPIEASFIRRGIRCMCVDIRVDVLKGAVRNMKSSSTYLNMDILPYDSTKLSRLLRGAVCDRIVMNPPYGIRVGTRMRMARFYSRLLSQSLELAKSTVTFITPRRRTIEDTFGGLVTHRRVIFQGGNYSWIFVMR